MFDDAGSSPLKFEGSSAPSRQNDGDDQSIDNASYTSASRNLFSTTNRRGNRSEAIKRPRTFVQDEDVPGLESSETSNARGPRVFIWGTRICISEVQHTFRKFLTEYQEKNPDDDELMLEEELTKQNIDQNLPFYLQKIEEIYHSEEPHLNVNLQHVKDFNEPLYRQIVCYPADVIPYLDMEANNIFNERFPDAGLQYQIQIRPFNADRTRNMRSLNPEDIDQLITISGMVIRTSSLIPEMRQGLFECMLCKNTIEMEIDRGRIEEPILCQNCATGHSFQLIHNRSLFMDKQIVKLQESPDDMPAGQTPHTVALHCYGDLVDAVQPGDRITVTGIYRAVPLRVVPRQRLVKAVYKTYIDVLHFRKTDVHRLHLQDDGTKLTADRIAQIKDLASKPDVYSRLAHAIAPSIYEHDDIKRGILCLLFGGTKKNFGEIGREHFRSDINVLLCGDPGTSKSQLLQYVFNLVPRGQYTSGKGSSAVGLTAYITRDPETKHFVLQTGALVLSDNGVCCIDEFDKMSDSTRSVLHEVMEQQTLSIAKAGIICQLNARTSLLAAANPVDSQWNKNKTIIENVQLPHTLLSRFDLIFLLVDPQDEYYDRRLAKHLVSLYYKSHEEEDAEYLDMSFLRDYISYVKQNCNPVLSDEASQNLIEKYVAMRKVGSGRGQVSAYPRQLESLIRLSEAHAKIRLSPIVEIVDVEEAYRLHREALKQSATDPLTGKVDVNILAAGMSTTTRKHVAELADAIKRLLASKPFGAWHGVKKLLSDVRENSDKMITRELYEEALNELCKNDILARGREGQVRLVKPVDIEHISSVESF